MRSTIPSQGLASNQERFAPKILYFDPLNAGPRQSWARDIELARDLGFDYLLSAPLFRPGPSGDVFISADHERAHPAIDPKLSADGLASELSIECHAHDLELYLDFPMMRQSFKLFPTGFANQAALPSIPGYLGAMSPPPISVLRRIALPMKWLAIGPTV